MKNFVDINWLKNNSEEGNLVILDARADLQDSKEGERLYKKSHIVNAHFVSLEKTMTGEIKKHGGRHPLPDLEEFADKMRDLGIDNDSKVIIYDSGDLAMAGRLWWMLKYIGLDKVYILEGGFKEWEKMNYPITDEIPEVKSQGNLKVSINKDIFSDIEDVKKAMDSDKKVIVDSRAEDRYSGKVEPFDRIPGHIPEAVNYPWTKLVESNSFMNEEELEEYFKDIKDYDEIIVHCGSGITGTVNILFMEEIGLKPKLYLGGYSDWVSYLDNEVVSNLD